MITAVVFDVGETLVDETREYGTWADWLGVPRHTFSAAFGAVISSGRDYREVFEHFRPGFDLGQERQRRIDRGEPEIFGEENLYPDARPCLKRLQELGVWVGIAGNQTKRAGDILRGMGFAADMIATSDDWGVEKPQPGFFNKVIASAGCKSGELMYVGDRLDADLRPAKAAGILTAFICRGPWGNIWRDHPDLEWAADWRINTLEELPGIVESVNELAN
jgi:HAD superfamily hydrolase (TIGR01549 family)